MGMRLAPIRAYVSKEVSGKLTRWKRGKKLWQKERNRSIKGREGLLREEDKRRLVGREIDRYKG